MSGLGFQVIAERALNSIPEGILIAIMAWLLLRLVGKQNSGTRFAVWFVAMLAIVVLPFVRAFHLAGTVTRAVHAEITLPGSWAIAILAIWGTVTVFGLLRLAYSFWRLQLLRTNSTLVTESELGALSETIAVCRAVRSFEIRTSSDLRIPTAVGFHKPAILIPDWAWHDLSVEELRSIVLHEFAHLQRRDDWTNLAQKVVRAMFFFHPAVLWIEKRLSLEREMACDDLVLAETKEPNLYAQCLVSLAEKNFLRRSIAVAQAAIGRAHETTLRLAQILDKNRPSSTRVFKPVLASLTAVVAVSFVAVQNAPRLISFADPVPATIAQSSAQVDEASPQIEKSMVIPASAKLEHPHPALPKRTKRSIVPLEEKSPEFVAKQQAAPAAPVAPMYVPASATEQVPAAQYLVVTQADFYQDGSAFVSYAVFRVTVVKQHPPVRMSDKAPNRT